MDLGCIREVDQDLGGDKTIIDSFRGVLRWGFNILRVRRSDLRCVYGAFGFGFSISRVRRPL